MLPGYLSGNFQGRKAGLKHKSDMLEGSSTDVAQEVFYDSCFSIVFKIIK